MEQLKSLRWQVMQDDPSFWVGYFQWLEEQKNGMSDPGLATRLFLQGRKAIQASDLVSLKASCRQLHGLLPEDSQEEASSRGFGSNII